MTIAKKAALPSAWDLMQAATDPTATTTTTATTMSVAAAPLVTTAATTAPPGGVVEATSTKNVYASEGTSGLTANTAIASLTEAGGTAGDAVTFALAGTGAGSFKVTTVGNVGTLSTGSAGAAGATNGKAYALTLTCTDTVNGQSSPAISTEVVVGSAGADTVSVATLVGASGTSATWAFIYGLGGGDKINATGMTGKLFFMGGGGGDTMTGGSGVNTYVYGNVNESTGSAMDIVTNFVANRDHIDLTGIGTSALTYAGTLASSVKTLAANSISVQSASGNTFVYVNTTGASEAITAANLKIELQGSVAVGALNFTHN
jgi:hypothetical protein